MRAARAAALALPGAAAALAGLLVLQGRPRQEIRVDPSPLGPAARVLQGPLSAGRQLLLPFTLLQVNRLLAEGKLEEGRKAALRFLLSAPWFQPVWIQVAWATVYSGWDELSTAEKVRRMEQAVAWLALASRVLPSEPDPPATLAFLLTERLPPGSPQALEWKRIEGKSPALEADRWLREALRRAPWFRPFLARRSAVAVRLAGEAWFQGDKKSSLAFLQRALDLESRLARGGSATARTWVEDLKGLRNLLARPRPWPEEARKEAARTPAGALFFQAARIQGG